MEDTESLIMIDIRLIQYFQIILFLFPENYSIFSPSLQLSFDLLKVLKR